MNGHVLGQEDLHKTMGQIMKECSSEKIIYVDGEIYFPTDRDECRTLEQFMAGQ